MSIQNSQIKNIYWQKFIAAYFILNFLSIAQATENLIGTWRDPENSQRYFSLGADGKITGMQFDVRFSESCDRITGYHLGNITFDIQDQSIVSTPKGFFGAENRVIRDWTSEYGEAELTITGQFDSPERLSGHYFASGSWRYDYGNGAGFMKANCSLSAEGDWVATPFKPINLQLNSGPTLNEKNEYGHWNYYIIVVPKDAAELTFFVKKTAGEYPDIYTDYMAAPTQKSYICHKEVVYQGDQLQCVEKNPAPGLWWLAVGDSACEYSVTATINGSPSDLLLSISKTGTGYGNVSSLPEGIECDSDCAKFFPKGTKIILKAEPISGSIFTGWSDNCTITNSSDCQVELNQTQLISANFELSETLRSQLDWQVAEIYISTLGYAPDSEGMQYWTKNLQDGWAPLTVAQSFFDQPLVQAQYPEDQGYDPFIEALYQNLFGRAPDMQGYNYWLAELESGHIARNQMIIALIEAGWSNPEAATDMARFSNRVQVGLAFAAEQAARGILYSTLSSEQQARLRELGAQVLEGVTADMMTRDTAIQGIPAQLDTL